MVSLECTAQDSMLCDQCSRIHEIFSCTITIVNFHGIGRVCLTNMFLNKFRCSHEICLPLNFKRFMDAQRTKTSERYVVNSVFTCAKKNDVRILISSQFRAAWLSLLFLNIIHISFNVFQGTTIIFLICSVSRVFFSPFSNSILQLPNLKERNCPH